MDIKFAAKKMLFKVKNSSPTLMLVGGIIGFGVSAYLFSKGTLEVDKVLDESRKNVETIHSVRNNPETAELYSEKQMQSDLAKVYGKTVGGLVKIYGPAAATFALSTFLVLKSHNIMGKRVAALGATVGALSRALKKQNERIKELYGEEKADDIWLGAENQKVESVVKNEETGEEQKKKVTAKVINEELVVSPYAFVFDEQNPNYISGDPQHNVDFLVDYEAGLERKLKAQGYLFLNDVRQAYGMKPIPVGQVVGWIYDESNPDRHNCIDIGINHKLRSDVRDFRAGISKTFVIDPNVDGIIVEDFFKFDKSNTVF